MLCFGILILSIENLVAIVGNIMTDGRTDRLNTFRDIHHSGHAILHLFI